MRRDLFRALHDHCQTLTPKIHRNQIISKIKELTGEEKVLVVKLPLDAKVTRGFFLHASNTEHPLVRDNGRHIICISKENNPCWQRFVNVKEAMHLFDDDGELTDTKEKYERLLSDFSAPPVERSTPANSDIAAIWMALVCFCPETARAKFQALLKENQIDHYGIALQLKIPELYVPLLFRPTYNAVLEILRGEGGDAV